MAINPYTTFLNQASTVKQQKLKPFVGKTMPSTANNAFLLSQLNRGTTPKPVVKPAPSVVSPGTAASPQQQMVNRVASAPANNPIKPMTFDANQLAGLNSAYQRQMAGNINDTDTKNLKYAIERGFSPTATANPNPAPSPMSPLSPISALTSVQNPNLIQPSATSDNAYREAYNAYIASLAPSSDLNSAKQKYTDFIAASNLGIDNLEGQGRGIPLGLVRGQQEKLYNQSQIEADRLQGNVGLAQDAQTQAQNQALAGMNMQKSIYDTSATQNKEMMNFQNELLMGGYKPATGQEAPGSNVISLIDPSGQTRQYVAPAVSSKGYQELAAGASLYDPMTGQLIATAPKETENPTSYKEWQLAGSPGTYQEWVTSKGGTAQNIVKINGVDYIQNADGSFTTPQVPQSTLPSYGEERSGRVVQSVDELLAKVDANPGIFGRTAGAPIPNWLRSDDFRNFESELNTLAASIAFNELTAMREASKTGGALGSVSERELELLTSALGALNMNQSPENFKAQLSKIKESINRWQSEVNKSKGGGAGSDPLGLGFNQGDTDQNVGVVKLGSRLAQVNNNPGNLRYVGQAGATQGEGGFARFSTPQAGYNALVNQIKLDASRGLTLAQFINKYAPPVENDTGLYVKQMVQATGANPNTKISTIDINLLAKAMAKKESGSYLL